MERVFDPFDTVKFVAGREGDHIEARRPPRQLAVPCK